MKNGHKLIKHIKRKTVALVKLDQDTMRKLSTEAAPIDVLQNIRYDKVKRHNAIQIMEDGEVVFSFFYNDHGNACTIPLANPVLIYFNTAQMHLRNIYSRRTALLGLFRGKTDINEDAMKLFYEFFGLTSSFITMLMTSLEAFVNQHIDKDYKYEKPEQKKYMRVYDYEQILRWISLDEKIEEIINKKYSKSFAKTYPLKYDFVRNLKDIRDRIIHTKQGENHHGYIELFRKSLDFKFSECIEAVRDFINFYEPSLIEACPCNIDD